MACVAGQRDRHIQQRLGRLSSGTMLSLLTRESAWALIQRRPNEWYAYVLWRRDKVVPQPFYVGKGKNYRAMHHELPSKGGRNPVKQRIIDKQHRHGIPIGYSLAFYPSEEEAFAAEQRLIARHGRRDLESGILCNLTDGGDGEAGRTGLKGDTNPRARACLVGGRRFSYVGAAALHLQIDSSLVLYRIKSGWPGYYYEDEGQRAAKQGIIQRYRKEIYVLEAVYPSLSEAARATGMKLGTIAKRVAYGWDGYFYVDEGQRPRREKGRRSDNVPVVIDGVPYFSFAKAGQARGEPPSLIAKRCGSSNFPGYRFADASREETQCAPPHDPVVVVAEGRTFSSIAEASRVFSLTWGAVHSRCGSSNFPDWRYDDAGRQASISFDAAFSSAPKSVSVEGTVYMSQSAAAEAAGIDINTLKKRCRSTSFPDYLSDEPSLAKLPPKDGRPGLIAVEIDGTTHRSVSRAAAALQLTRPIVRDRCSDPDWPAWRFR